MFRRLAIALTLLASFSAGSVASANEVLIVHAVGPDGATLLPGACFEVYVDAGGGARGNYVNASCDRDDTLEDGNVLLLLTPGNYVLAESVQPAGYDLAPDQPVTVAEDTVQEATVVHAPIGTSPTPTPAATPGNTGQTTTGQPPSGPLQGRFEISPGRSLYLNCQGSGGPAVILEAGGPGLGSDSWQNVQAQIATSTRACAYDRAGIGQSDPAPEGQRTIQDSVNDLHALLASAGIACPCIFVGSSWGGTIVRLYAAQFPGDIAGLVSVDGIPPGFLANLMALVGNDAPAEAQAERDRLLGSDNPEHVDQLTSLQQADAVQLPAGIPAAVMTHDRTIGLGFSNVLPVDKLEDAWRADQERYAAALNARLIVAEKSGNDIVAEQPDLVVGIIEYVLQVVVNPAESYGRIQVLPSTIDGAPLPGACFQLWADDGSGGRGNYVNGVCDGDDGVVDGSILFAKVVPGHYVLQVVTPPPGYLPIDDIPVNVPPADLTQVPIVMIPAPGTPVAETTARAV